MINEFINVHFNQCAVVFVFSLMCKWCKRLLYSIKKKQLKLKNKQNVRTYLSPIKKRIIHRIQRVKKTVKQKCSRLNKNMLKIQKQLSQVKMKMKNMAETKLDKLLVNEGIPNEQFILIKEIFHAARFKNPKSRKYNENWMMSCLLFQIRLVN